MPYTFTLSGAGAFDLFSMDLGALATGFDPASLTVTGFFSAGGSISSSVDPMGPFATFLFPGFTNLSSVQFGLNSLGSEDAALDNIVVQQTGVTVPEPASFVLFATGAAAVVLRRGRRSSRSARHA